MSELKVWTCTKFTGHYPVGVAAVAIAYDAYSAAIYLNHFLAEAGLEGDAKAEDMEAITPFEDGQCRILCDGNY